MKKDSEQIAAPLVAWYQTNKRPLPWRADKEPYHVWVSEIMLQQTRIEAVMQYYARFMQALPTVETLAAADEETLLKLWEGLGYYSRARNLKKAAQTIMAEYNGQFPAAFSDLRKLAGIGDYTAGAIASICFQERVPAVDGNVLRVLARLRGDYANVLLPQTKKEAETWLKRIIPAQAGDFNEGLMELGETRCLPNTLPLCADCPLQPYCTAYHENLTAELPVREKQQKRKKEIKTVFLIRAKSGEIAIEKRRNSGLLAGLYQFPNVDGDWEETALQAQLRAWNLNAVNVHFFKNAKHIFTHIEWQMKAYLAEVEQPGGNFEWVTPQTLQESIPLPTAFQKFTDILY